MNLRPPSTTPDPEPTQLRFQVSLNEEHAFLTIALENRTELDLGERVHHYSLLTLARRRLDDARHGVDPSCQGWIEVAHLARMLGIDPTHLNIQLFRARSQIARALPPGTQLPSLIERRRGELRLGALPFQIMRGSRLEGSVVPGREPA
ncbi:hypothetical protein [Massilia sp. erpn]|uniref:hypothetical protein n=1 Tax=Massilia sp. erpn TaxID=2738142 RepID=UPI00210733A9|nr:hypothetical protein [Massilia sp. erpn]UTY56249.1 hypothetical protein HPQ68_03015 [Massilia sp. erpn]